MAVDGYVLQLVDLAPVCGEGIAITEEGAHPEKGIGAALGNGVEAAAPVYEGTLAPHWWALSLYRQAWGVAATF